MNKTIEHLRKQYDALDKAFWDNDQNLVNTRKEIEILNNRLKALNTDYFRLKDERNKYAEMLKEQGDLDAYVMS